MYRRIIARLSLLLNNITWRLAATPSRRCGVCGHYTLGAKYCDQDGSMALTHPRCRCGYPIADFHNYCPDCGTKVTTPITYVMEQKTKEVQPKCLSPQTPQ